MAYPVPTDNTITSHTASQPPPVQSSLPTLIAEPERSSATYEVPTRRGIYLGRRVRTRSFSSPLSTIDRIKNDGDNSFMRRRAAGVDEKTTADSTTIELTDLEQTPKSNSDNNLDNSVATEGPRGNEVLTVENQHPKEIHQLEKDNGEEQRHPTWTDRLHGERPDRHLFPYRSAKENMRAARTFLFRFFFIFLIIPAWVVPHVLTAKAKHDLEVSHNNITGEGHGTNGTELQAILGRPGSISYVYMAAAAEAGSEGSHGPELSKGANIVIFILNMLVMMHLGKAAGVALEELVPRFGHRIISILDAMTSSSVELAVAAFALKKGLIFVVQAAMLGAILNNLLLETTQTSVNVLMLTCMAYIIPIALDITLVSIHQSALPGLMDPLAQKTQFVEIRQLVDGQILKLSKIMSVVLLLLYASCLWYQFHHRTFMITPEAKHEGPHTVERRYTHFWFAGFAYLITMAAQIFSANLLVHAVEGLGRQFHLNDGFVGFVLLPIILIADLQEEVVAIRESRANHLDKAVALMVGSCMQIALLVTPILVLLGWILDQPMTLRFTILEVAVLSGTVLLINWLIADHETNWFEGVLLLALFIMCAIAFYYDNSHAIVPGEGVTLSGEGDAGSGH
ncbi:hypothetical protein BGX28_001795 [Mortierella sp. GBA30]|nr:hypothetical protein BGX28_001795 [Mortierella sp. GBA30]